MNDIRGFIGKDTMTVSEAMQKIDNNAKGILFLVNGEDKLVGCITDGDIRRFLLSGRSMNGLAVDAANREPKTAHSTEEAKKLYHRRNYIIIPIIDEEGFIIGLYDGEEFDRKPRNNLGTPVVINAGGKGTRLDPFTRVLPKPLIPVGDMPIIEHIMQRYEEAGCFDFSIIVNYKKQLIKSYFSEIDRKYNIHWVVENEPLGTGGGLSLLRNKIKDTFFFISCDNLLLADYEDIIRFHKKNKNDITMICARKKITIPYGIVNTNDKNVLETIEEKPEYSFLTNTAMYVIEPAILKDIKKNTRIDFPDIIKMEKEKGRKIGVYSVEEDDWLDMGVMSELEKMRIRLYGE